MHPFTTKNRHIGERIIEWSIRIVASFSILVIFLIFIFVFKEAASLFGGSPDAPTEQTSEATATQSVASDAPESYTSDDASAPESYTPDESAPESYTPDDASAPESYTSDDDTSTAAVAAAGPSEPFTDTPPDRPEIYNPDSGPDPGSVEVVRVSDPVAPTPLSENIFGDTWQPVGESPKFGVWPLLVGTFKTTLIAILIGAPLGILAAMFSAFFAPRWMREIVKPAIELLAGFPSVVIGFFCLATVATFIQDTFDTQFRLNAIVGGFGLSLAIIPIVFTIAEDALSAVPKTLREASLALGSTEWQTAYRVMLPAAAPGVFAAVLLGVGRAFGETMIAIMATGNAPFGSWSIFAPARTVAATIGSEMGEVVWGSEHYGVLFLLGAGLFVVSFALNAVTELYVKQRLMRKFQGA